MIISQSIVDVKGIKAEDVYDFMINCTDKKYQDWWPGVHIAFDTIKRYPGNLGNVVCFDEFVGKRRLKFKGKVIKSEYGKEIVWQMTKIVKLPAWVHLTAKNTNTGVSVSHTLKVGFTGLLSFLDLFISFFITKKFQKELDDHAHYEFNKLADVLSNDT